MFQGEFLPNLIVFLIGQAAAWGYLRTGLVPRGLVSLIGGWVLADAALVARFAYDQEGAVFVASLAGMQMLAVFEAFRFVVGRTRRRMPAAVVARRQASREAFVRYLRNDLEGAIAGYRSLVRRDPWDLTSRFALGRAWIRSGDVTRGRRALRAARRLDRDGRYADLLHATAELRPLRAAAAGADDDSAQRSA